MSTLPSVGSKNRHTRLTSVDLPAPVSPTIATFVPCGTFRLKCSSTYSSPSGYLNVTSSNSTSPCSASQFSRLGLNASPYFSTTSGASLTSLTLSVSAVNRSTLTLTDTRSASASTAHCTGSTMPCA